MKSRDEREYKILFLLDRDKKIVAIDRSYADKLRPILRKHRYGEVPYTADLFDNVPNRAIPVMYVYPTWENNGKRADGLVLLWAEAFEEAGYLVRVRLGLEEKRRIQKIVMEDRRGKPSISEILENDEIECLHHEQDTKVERVHGRVGKKYVREKTTDVLNIRVKKETAELFRSFCEESGLTQDRALATLLDLEKEISGNGDSETDYEELNDIILDLENELDEANVNLILYKKKYSDLKDNGYIRRKDQAYELKERLVREFLKYCPITQYEHMIKVHCYSHKQAIRLGNWYNEYMYPLEDGITLIRLEHVCYGRVHDAPLFIFGRTEDGRSVKFRFYNKRSDFLGKSIARSDYSKISSRWLCAYLVSEEGVADLIGALPLGSSWIHEDERRKMEYLRDLAVAEERKARILVELNSEAMIVERPLGETNDNTVEDILIEEDTKEKQLEESEKRDRISLDDKLKDANSRAAK